MKQGRQPPMLSQPESPEENRYDRRVSGVFRVGKYLCLLLLAGLSVLSLTVWRPLFSYDTFRFLIREINASGADLSGGFADVTFEEQQQMVFRLYRGTLAVAGRSRLSLFNAAGSVTASYSLNYDQPALYPSDTNLLAVDLGGTAYSLYTPLACVESADTEYAITGAAISRGGSYVLITRSSEARYQVTVWNRDRRKAATYYRDDYVFSAALSDDGKTLVILSGGVQDFTFRTLMTFCTVGTNDTGRTVELSGEMPLSAHCFSDGNVCLLTDRSAIFFDRTGTEIRRISASEWSRVDFSDTYAVLAVPRNAVGSSHRLTVTDSTGTALADTVVENRLKWVSAADGGGETLAYLLLPEETAAVTAAGIVRREPYSGSSLALLAAGSYEYAILCRSSGAVSVLNPASSQ